MATYVYHEGQVQVHWLGMPLTEGLAAGTAVSYQDQAAPWTWLPDGLGGGIRMFNRNRAGTINVTVEVTHPVHARLLALAQIDLVSRNLVGPFSVLDISTGQLTIFNGAYIVTEPDEQRGTGTIPGVWQFQYRDKVVLPANVFAPINLLST